MKVILSRKGFDSVYGGRPSPILPDGRMISLPIPSEYDNVRYSDLKLNFGKYKTYYDMMKELMPEITIPKKEGNKKRTKKVLTKDTRCHLDPDLYPNVIKRLKGWKPIFGQIYAAQTHLENKGVKAGDIFLFFGTFRKTELVNGKLKFAKGDKDKHIIFGYLQIGEKIKVKNRKIPLPEWMTYHPHAEEDRKANNTMYIARDTLSFCDECPGAGVFKYHRSLILTKENYSKSRWELPSFFKNVEISYHSPKSWKNDYFQSTGRGQEFVIQDNKNVEKWVKKLITSNAKQ